MTIETCFESEDYRFDYDTLAGVGWYVRKSDDYVSLMLTGTEAYKTMRSHKHWAQDDCKCCIEAFDKLASRHDYTSRWTREK